MHVSLQLSLHVMLNSRPWRSSSIVVLLSSFAVLESLFQAVVEFVLISLEVATGVNLPRREGSSG